MSVIPLTIEGPDRTVVQTPEDFSSTGRAIFIAPLDTEQFKEQGNSNVSYDLRVGSQFRDHHKRKLERLDEKGIIEIGPGRAVLIDTEERVMLPNTMYGVIAPRLSLLEVGLSTTFSKVDPGFNGSLRITLFNLGKATVPLQRCERVCALTVFGVLDAARMYNKPSRPLGGELAKRPREGAWEWIRGHQTLAHSAVILLLILSQIMLFILSCPRKHP